MCPQTRRWVRASAVIAQEAVHDLVAVLLIALGLSAGGWLRSSGGVETKPGALGIEQATVYRGAVGGYTRHQPLFAPAVLAAPLLSGDWFMWLGALVALAALILIWQRDPFPRTWQRGIQPTLSGDDLDRHARSDLRMLFWCEIALFCTANAGGFYLVASNS